MSEIIFFLGMIALNASERLTAELCPGATSKDPNTHYHKTTNKHY